MIGQTHFVIDLETMGQGPNAAIVAIGCVRIDQGQITGEFYRRVCLEAAIKMGGEVDGDTITWWLKQTDAARAEISAAQPTDFLSVALVRLFDFMTSDGAKLDTNLVLGNGSSFDNVILGQAYRRLAQTMPWKYWNDRDLRTLLALYPEAKQAIPFEGTKHHALHDARHEAKLLCWVLERIAAEGDQSREWLKEHYELQAERDQLRTELQALSERYFREVYGLNSEGDPIGGDPAGGLVNENAMLRTALAAEQGESRQVLTHLLHLATDILTNPDAGMDERHQLARCIEGELQNNPLPQPAARAMEVAG